MRPLPICLAASTLCLMMAACGSRAKQPSLRDQPLINKKSPYEFHRAIGLTLLRTHQYDQAMPHVKRLVAMRDDRADGHYLLGRVYMGMDLKEAARNEFMEAIARDAKFAPAHAMLGVFLDTKSKHRAAEKAHRRAIALQRRNASFHNNLGFSLYLQKKYSAALKSYQRALFLDSSMRRVHNNLAFTYGKLGNLDAAYEHFRQGGNRAFADNNMGLVHEGQGNLDTAYGFFLKALTRSPKLTEARGNLARVCVALGRPMPTVDVPKGPTEPPEALLPKTAQPGDADPMPAAANTEPKP